MQLDRMPSQALKLSGAEVSHPACPARRRSQPHDMPSQRRWNQPTSSTGTLKAASSLCSVGAARLLLQLRMKRRGGGLSLG